MARKKVGIGVQNIQDFAIDNLIYVDKTEKIYELMQLGKHNFIVRPRRFGKSLLLDTIAAIYEGSKEQFQGTWAYNNIDWAAETRPTLRIDFTLIESDACSLEQGLQAYLQPIAEDLELNLTGNSAKDMFKRIIEHLGKTKPIAILIDEYEMAITDLVGKDEARLEENIFTLKKFYGTMKGSGRYIHRTYITGVTKIGQIGILSDLNMLNDLTLDERFTTLLGYTETELRHYYAEYITAAAKKYNMPETEILGHIKHRYNGYSWDGATRVYNPFGTLNFLDNRTFVNFWFATGNPKFLIEQMREKAFYNIENQAVNGIIFEKFDIENIELTSLLFQTGYLTVKELGERDNYYVLDYPNHEVRESMYQFLIDDLAKNIHRGDSGLTMIDLKKAFLVRDTEQVREILNGILSDLPNEAFLKQTEGLFHGLVHIIFNYLGIFIKSEVHSSRGRADAIVETPTDVFIFEFKINKTAAEAMAQIEKKKYADKYRASKKTLNGIAFNYNSIERCIDEWEEKTL